ncbi:hypothetical protein DFP73DRAFT_565519 [Morchella snyderi]|nr:hypothetical protein DFP73DRAFT_565519 [Morchella snyderi]
MDRRYLRGHSQPLPWHTHTRTHAPVRHRVMVNYRVILKVQYWPTSRRLRPQRQNAAGIIVINQTRPFIPSLLNMSAPSVDRWPVDSSQNQHKQQFSLSKRSSAFGQPVAFSEDVIPVANPRRLSRAPQLEEDYRRAQGEGLLSKSRAGGNKAPQAVVGEPVYPLDQFAVNESMTAAYRRRRSWALKPQSGAGPARPALVTIAEFEEGTDRKSGFVSCAASIAYTSPSVSRSTTYTSPTAATPEKENEHDDTNPPPLRSPPPPPRTFPAAPPIPKLPEHTPGPATFSPHPSPNQYIQQSARRRSQPQSQRIFRVNSRGTTPKRAPSKKSYSYPTNEKVITLGAARPKLIEIIPTRNSAPLPQTMKLAAVAPPYELPAVSSPSEMCAAAVVVVGGGGESPTTPTLVVTAPTPTPTPAPEMMLPAPTRPPPPPPVVVEEKTVYKPYRAPTPEVVVGEKPLPVIPPLKTGWPAWKKEEEADVVVVEKQQEGAVVEKKQEVVVIPEALRIGMASRSLEARLGNWEALAAGGRY